MSTLTLVRHGQATAFERTSDRLSELGERQSRLLGEWWARRGAAFDAAFCGTMDRQRRTAELVKDAYSGAFPAIREDAGWNEYDATGVLGMLAPALAERDAGFRQLWEDAARYRATPERNRYFQKMFETIMRLWVPGEVGHPEVEPFAAFQDRVRAAAQRIVDAAGPSRRVVVFTSGGPIGTLTQMAVNAPPAMAMELNWRVRNSSVTEFLFSGGRMTLDSFNALPHLDDGSLWSYR
jgi:broad specificity phosphatase PhoE